MPPRLDRTARTLPERRALQDAIAWPIVIALLTGAVVIFFLPRIVPAGFLALAVGVVFAIVTVALVVSLSMIVERWLRRHAHALAQLADRQVQTVGLAGLPVATGDGALIPLASAYADAGARAALLTAERESSELLARLGSNASASITRTAASMHSAITNGSHPDIESGLASIGAIARALRHVTDPVPTPAMPVDLVGIVRDIAASMPIEGVHLELEADRGVVLIDRDRMHAHLRDLLALAHRASLPDGRATVHVSRVFRSNIEETPVRRTGDSRLTIVPRSSGDALRAWVLRAQPGAEVLSIIITDEGTAPSPDVQQRAFDPFALERDGDPLGVTLAAVRRTVQAARGTIWVD
ncbi:MAG TPA: ATP-binding protein, partial [Gemmatimonadaceae bacterium]|nr:ATP-binding protein [Gemmatimonadaceae bacterium]